MKRADNFKKVVRVGVLNRHPEQSVSVFCKVEYKGGGVSFTGVEGPKANGDSYGSCGQIIIGFKEYDHRGYKTLADITPAPGWGDTEEEARQAVRRFFDTWDRWHLNHMKAGSPAQEEYLRRNPVIAVYPESHYTKACEALAAAGLHPDADGYRYGSKWLREEVPDEVLEYLRWLPDTDRTPAWV